MEKYKHCEISVYVTRGMTKSDDLSLKRHQTGTVRRKEQRRTHCKHTQLAKPRLQLNPIFTLVGSFLSCFKPLFESEAKWEAINMKMIFYSLKHKTHFNNIGFSVV